MDDLIPRVAVLEQIARNTDAALTRLEGHFERLERRLDRIETRLDTIEARRHSDFKWLMGVMFTGFSATLAGFVGLLGVMAHGFKWI